MKSFGVIRKIDKLGRIILPAELRQIKKLNAGDSVEIFVDEHGVYLRAYKPGCILCDNVDKLVDHKGYKICSDCLSHINNNYQSSTPTFLNRRLGFLPDGGCFFLPIKDKKIPKAINLWKKENSKSGTLVARLGREKQGKVGNLLNLKNRKKGKKVRCSN